jgi:hypothetical protein
VNLDDPQDILRFANEYDVLGVYEPTENWRAISAPLNDLWSELEPKLVAERLQVGEVLLAEERAWAAGHDSPELRAAYAAMSGQRTAEHMAWHIDPSYESVEEFRAGAAAIALAVAYWRYLLGDQRLHAAMADHDADPARLALRATDFLASFFDWGLEPIHPGLSVYSDHPITGATFRQRPSIETTPQARPAAHLYHLCCLELYNHIVEGATYRQCANEPCGRTFVRHQGRAEHGQHRTKGIKYCSAHCARAQAQRELRRRRRHQAD